MVVGRFDYLDVFSHGVENGNLAAVEYFALQQL
jgi:hypothetical protein